MDTQSQIRKHTCTLTNAREKEGASEQLIALQPIKECGLLMNFSLLCFVLLLLNDTYFALSQTGVEKDVFLEKDVS